MVGLAVLSFVVYMALLFWAATRIESGIERPESPGFSAADVGADRTPGWTRDGQTIVISMGTQISTNRDGHSLAKIGTSRLYVVSANGRRVWPIAAGRGDEQYSPSVSPDGRIAYASYRYGGWRDRDWVEVVGLEDVKFERIVEARIGSRQVWSPAGTHLATQMEGGIAIFSEDGSPVREIAYANRSGNVMSIAWSNDNRYLALSRGVHATHHYLTYRIEVMDTHGSDQYVIADLGLEYTSDLSKPAWSSDGDGLYFTEQTISPTGQQTKLYFVDVLGGTRNEVAQLGDGVNVVYVKASPDGQRLLFRSEGNNLDQGLRGLYTIGTDGQNLAKLLDFPADASWSPSGDRIAAFDGFRLWVINADGTDLTLLTDVGPDGRPIPAHRQ